MKEVSPRLLEGLEKVKAFMEAFIGVAYRRDADGGFPMLVGILPARRERLEKKSFLAGSVGTRQFLREVLSGLNKARVEQDEGREFVFENAPRLLAELQSHRHRIFFVAESILEDSTAASAPLSSKIEEAVPGIVRWRLGPTKEVVLRQYLKELAEVFDSLRELLKEEELKALDRYFQRLREKTPAKPE